MLFLRWYVWVGPFILLSIYASMFWRRRLYREFPHFASYVAFVLLDHLITFAAAFLTLRAYRWTEFAVSSIEYALEVMVFYELGDHLVFRRSPVASKLRPLARWTVASLILVAVASSALFAETGRERVVMAIQVLEYSASVVSIGLIFAILLLTRALRISWSSLPVGIALGFSVCACADLAAAALISVVGKVGWVGIDFIAMGAFHVAVVIWLLYILLPAKRPSFTGHRPDRTDLEAWDQELQKMVR